MDTLKKYCVFINIKPCKHFLAGTKNKSMHLKMTRQSLFCFHVTTWSLQTEPPPHKTLQHSLLRFITFNFPV